MRGNKIVSTSFERFSGVLLWIVFMAVFTAWKPHEFFTVSTFHSVAATQAVQGMLALAVLIPLVAGQFDLSVGATANLTGIVAIVAQTMWHWPVWAALSIAVLLGFFIGFVNGFIVVKLRVNSFIATLGMGSILSAFLVIVTNSEQPAPVNSTLFNNLSQYSIDGTSIVVFELILLALIVYWVMDWTPAGRRLYATGGNPEAARLSGIRVDRVAWTSLVVAGGIAGVSGILFSSLYGPSLSFGPALLLPAFAAAFLGSTQLQPGRFNVWGTLIAIYVLATGVEGLQLVSGQQWLSDMFNGVALILAVALAVSRERRDQSRKIRPRKSRSDNAGVEGFDEEPLTSLGTVEGLAPDTPAVVGAPPEYGGGGHID
ncbi:MAG TPA: ABC transporter permease [Acidimicrobiales bacterium]|jgi:ribose transport system permease protein